MAVLFPFYCISDGQRVDNVVCVGSDCERGTIGECQKNSGISGILLHSLFHAKLNCNFNIVLHY